MLYPQNGDRFVTIDSVTSLHPVYSETDERPTDKGVQFVIILSFSGSSP